MVFVGKTTPKVPFFKDSASCPKILDYALLLDDFNYLMPGNDEKYRDLLKMLEIMILFYGNAQSSQEVDFSWSSKEFVFS